MSKHNESNPIDPHDDESRRLPADLAEFEQELRMMQPKAPTSLTAQRILGAALDNEIDEPAPANSDSPKKVTSNNGGWSQLVVTAVLSSALTALLMIWLRPAPEVVETIRVVHAPSNEAARDDSFAIRNIDDSASKIFAVAWTPVGSRAAELQQLDRLLRADADRSTPTGASVKSQIDLDRAPTFMRLQKMLSDS